MSAPILDAPDRQVQALWQRKMSGGQLTRAEEQRLLARIQAEEQVAKEGGSAKRSLLPAQPKPLTAQQQAKGETQWGVDYLKSKDATLKANGLPGVLPAGGAAVGAGAMTGMNAAIRKSAVTNTAPDDVKSLDNMKGPHKGADGLPANWKMPATVAGSYGGQDMTKPLPGSKGVPDGYGVLQGADGTWRVSGPGGMVMGEGGQRRSFKDMDEVNAYFSGLGKPEGSADNGSALGEDAELDSLRRAASTNPEVQPQPAPAAVSTTPPPAAVTPGAAPEAAMQRVYNPMTAVPQGAAPAQMPSAAAVMAATPAAGVGSQMDALLAEAMKKRPVQVPAVASPAPRSAPITPMPTTAPKPSDTAFGPNPVTDFVAGMWNRFSSAVMPPAPGTPRVSQPAMAGPLSANTETAMAVKDAQKNSGALPVPGRAMREATNPPGAPKSQPTGPNWGRQPQMAPNETFNPFATQQPRRRRLNVLPA